MTRKEAIEFGKLWLEVMTEDKGSNTYEFFKLAIKALEQEPCEDAISRQAVKANIVSVPIAPIFRDDDVVYRKVIFADVIDALPPVMVQEKTGRWIDTGSGQKCSECGEIQYGYDSFRRFCASCGIRMVEPQERRGKE